MYMADQAPVDDELRSIALPFAAKPQNLNGELVGDVGACVRACVRCGRWMGGTGDADRDARENRPNDWSWLTDQSMLSWAVSIEREVVARCERC
jgi:hypothetical protein